MIQEFARVLRAQYREEIDSIKDHLARGAAENFDEYKRLVGQIQGLAAAEERLTALAKKADDDE